MYIYIYICNMYTLNMFEPSRSHFAGLETCCIFPFATRQVFAGRYAFLGFDRRRVLQWLEIWRTADLLYFEARKWLGRGTGRVFFANGDVLLACLEITYIYNHI